MTKKREASLMPDSTDHRASSSSLDEDPLLSRGASDTVQMMASIIFRVATFIFLRWIPSSPLGWPVIPMAYALYSVTWLLHDWRVRSYVSSLFKESQLRAAKQDLKQLGEQVKAEASGQHTETEEAVENEAKPNGAVVPPNMTPREAELELRPLSAWETVQTLVSGHSTRSRRVNLAYFAAHALLFLFYLDFFTSPYLYPSHLEHNLYFSRVGAIGPTSATVHVRYPYPLGHPDDYSQGGIVGLPFGKGNERAERATWAALIEEEATDGSLGGFLHDGNEVFRNPEPLRVVYREVIDVGAPSRSRRRSPSSASDDEAALPGSPASIDGRPRAAQRRWERGPLLHITAKSDWTASGTIENLWPATQYEWRLAFVHNSTFAPEPVRARRFLTWPDPRLAAEAKTRGEEAEGKAFDFDSIPQDDPNHFVFGTSSCVKPDFPWAPTQFWAWSWLLRLTGFGDQTGGFATRNRVQGFDKLATSTVIGREWPALRFFLQLGDLIYADVPRWGGPTTAAYRKMYRNLFASDSFRRVYERLPVIGIYDDHEVVNNWGGKVIVEEPKEGVVLFKERESFEPANVAWKEYVGKANPTSLDEDESYYTFRYGDAAFFVWDTRKHRIPAELDDIEGKTMLGWKQRDAFIRWLGAVNSTATFKFVVSSVPFTTLWGGPLDIDSKSDSWAAYQTEREELLAVMQFVPNIIVLSGDRHEFAAVGIAPQGTREHYHPITEFSTSPLNMFYLPIRTLSQDNGLGPTGAERLYKYVPDGNVKWTELEVDTRDAVTPFVNVRLMVDGKEVYRTKVVGKGLRSPTLALGGLAKTFFELLRWRPARWF